MLEQRLNDWVRKVLASQNPSENEWVDTREMLLDVDKIIAEEFDKNTLLQ